MAKKVFTLLPLIVLLVIIQTKFGVVEGGTEWQTTLVTFFVAILVEAMPFVLIGSLISGILEALVPQESIANFVPKNRFLAIVLFGLIGALFPMCECGIVPVIRRLLRKGVPLSCGITYLLAAPIVQPLVLAATFVAFNGSWQIAGLRILGGYLVAVTVGLLAAVVLDPNAADHIAFEMHEHDDDDSCCGHDRGHEHTHDHEHGESCACGDDEPDDASLGTFGKIEMVLKHATEDFLQTGAYLIFGAFLAACMQTFIGQSVLAQIGHGPITSVLVMMVLAFTMSLCSAADAFVAAAFTQFSITSRLAFLVMGPMVDIKLLAMYNGFLSKKATIFVFGLASVLAFVYAVSLQALGVK